MPQSYWFAFTIVKARGWLHAIGLLRC